MKNKKCVLCNGRLKKKLVKYEIYGKVIGKFNAFVCDSCDERWFDEKTARKIEEAEKKAGIFGLSRETKVSYSGNSLIIRIPKELAKFMNLKKETKVILYPENKDKLCISLK